MNCNVCLNKCYGEGCCYVDWQQVQCLLRACRVYLADLYLDIIKAYKYTVKEKARAYLKLRRSIVQFYTVMRKEWEAYKVGFRSCLCDKDLCKLIEQINKLLPEKCKANCLTDQIII